MIFDSGSSWLWVSAKNCISCPLSTDKFDEKTSTTCSSPLGEKNLYYGSGNVSGTMFEDMVCITDNSFFCTQDFVFLNVYEQTGLDSMATTGIVGLAPNGDGRGDLFVEKFTQAGIIDQAVFSLYIELANETSQIAFGGYSIE